jgi:flavin-dependent dehydrogenase
MGDFDAIAIGGGLAGAAFALELCRHGLKVAVIERSRGPHHKVCGDFHSREAQELLTGLGLDLARLGASSITRFRLVSGGREATAPLSFSAAGLSRFSLDEAMLGAAQAAGVEILRGASVTGIEPGDADVIVRIGPRALKAKSVALATGKHNLRGWPRAHGAMTAFKIQMSLAPAARALLSDVVQLVGYRGGYIGACNVEDGVVTICWLADRDLMTETAGDWSRQLAHVARQSAYFGDLMGGARFLAKEPTAVSAIPFGYTRKSVIGRNIFPVGDQLAVIPSLAGDGTSLALASGLRAARAVLAGESAGAYQAASLAQMRAQFGWARAVHVGWKSGFMRALSVGALHAVPRLAAAVAELTRARGIDGLISADPRPRPRGRGR